MAYKVLSSSRSRKKARAWVVEGRGLTKKQALKKAAKLRGLYCAPSEGAITRKSSVRKGHCYTLHTHIAKE